MAAAESSAGGLGSLGLGADTTESAARVIAAVRALTRGPVHMNLFCHRPAVPDAQIERAWLARLRPEFERYGAEPPAQISEIYRSFVGNTAMLQLLLDTKPEIV